VPRATPHKGALLARLAPGLRPKLSQEELRQISLCHVINLDAIATGQAKPSMLWDYFGSVLLWSRVAQVLQVGVPEICVQLELCERLVERYGRTELVRFDGPDYQLAKTGVEVMDQLANLVDPYTAAEASVWSTREISAIAAGIASLDQDVPHLVATQSQTTMEAA
jgi:hypothetical protein